MKVISLGAETMCVSQGIYIQQDQVKVVNTENSSVLVFGSLTRRVKSLQNFDKTLPCSMT